MKSLATLVPLLRVLPVLLVQPVSFALPLLSAQPVLPVPCVQPVLRVLPLLAVPSAPVAGQVAAPVACVAPGCVEQRAVSPSGRRYVVVREAAGGGVTFELRERRAGVEPMAPARRDLFAAEDHIASDPADRLLARGGYGQRPREVIVPDDLPGCVMFENMGAFGRGTVAAWIDADGTQRFALDLRAIFGDTPFVTPPGCTPWHEGHALDEARGVLLLLGQRGEVREIAIPSGVVATPSTRRLAELAPRRHRRRRHRGAARCGARRGPTRCSACLRVAPADRAARRAGRGAAAACGTGRRLWARASRGRRGTGGDRRSGARRGGSSRDPS